MAVLTEAELLLGLSRHLAAFATASDRAALSELEFVGQVYDMAFRLRGSTTTTSKRVQAISRDIGLKRRELRDVMATLEALGWLTIERDKQDNNPVSISESIPPASKLVEAAPQVLAIAQISDLEQAALAVIRATTVQPLLRSEALEVASKKANDSDSEAAVHHLIALQLIRVGSIDSERDVLYNPNVWTQGDKIIKAALRAADAGATKEIGALLEEIAEQPGLPETHVTSTDQKWIDFAIRQGLLERAVIQTVSGDETGFLFTPHVARDPFGATAGDASGHVRQLVGAMSYASTFAKYQLHSPDRFLQSLIKNGIAGHTESIGTDYPMLEKAGIIRVVPGEGTKSRMELLQSDVAEGALTLLSNTEGNGSPQNIMAPFQGQKTYVPIERSRAKLALEPNSNDIEEARLIASLRDATRSNIIGKRTW